MVKCAQLFSLNDKFAYFTWHWWSTDSIEVFFRWMYENKIGKIIIMEMIVIIEIIEEIRITCWPGFIPTNIITDHS